jgi:16S rRNA (uracil1498-N3)-methyltransferase
VAKTSQPGPKAAIDRFKTRLFVEDGLAEGISVGLGAMQAHYLLHVLRLKTGDRVALFNGRDGEWLAHIDGFGRGWCSLAVIGRRRPQTVEPDLWLLFAPIKRARVDFLVQKATELGVSGLWPVFTRHTQMARVNTDRLSANATEAAEQCGRLSVPAIFEPAALDDVIARWPEDRRLLLCEERGTAPPVAGVLAAEAGKIGGGRGPREPWAVLTGPEGGFARSELDALNDLAFVRPVGLGPRILRAETAALAALTCWQAMLGDWRTGDDG